MDIQYWKGSTAESFFFTLVLQKSKKRMAIETDYWRDGKPRGRKVFLSLAEFAPFVAKIEADGFELSLTQ